MAAVAVITAIGAGLAGIAGKVAPAVVDGIQAKRARSEEKDYTMLVVGALIAVAGVVISLILGRK